MKKVLFVTGNQRKVWEAQDVLKEFDVQVEGWELDVVEIQSHDALEIGLAKAEAAFAAAERPLVVCDHFWSIPALGGFPGGYMADMNGWFTPQDFLRLMEGQTDRTIIMTDVVVYIDETGTKPFVSKHPAKVTDEAHGKFPVPCAQVIMFDGQTKTFAELVDEDKQIHDMSNSAWRKFGQWYSQQK